MRGLVREALAVIERDLAKEIALDDVARQIATSRRSLQRAFEGEGITFREAVAVARMRRARALLEERELPVYRIAERVGYRSKAEFTKAFKRYAGMTPTAYMRSVAGEGRSEDLDPGGPAGHLEAREDLGYGGPPQRFDRAELHR
jgi:AraC-like DNA-binding protein